MNEHECDRYPTFLSAGTCAPGMILYVSATRFVSLAYPDRPKHSTMAFSRDYQQRIELATNHVNNQYRAVSYSTKKNNKSRVKKGELTKIIDAAKKIFDIQPSTSIKIETIQSRLRNKTLNPATGIVKQGTPSPMIAVEPYIVQVISQLAKMRTPISVSTGLLLANSIISDTPTYDSLLEWKQKHNIHFRNTRKGALGAGYWRGFIKRNKHFVANKQKGCQVRQQTCRLVHLPKL